MGSSIVLNEHSYNEENRFTWKIPKFSSIKKHEEVRCTFKMGSKIGLPYDCDWKCCLIRSGCDSNYFNRVQIELFKCPPSIKELNVLFNAKIYKPGSNNGSIYASTAYSNVNMAVQKWTSDEIIRHSPGLPLNKDGSLEIEVSNKLKSPNYSTLDDILSKFSPKFTEKLQSDFSNMLYLSDTTRADSPAVIVCKVDNVKFPVHRGMLAARSIVFSTMFEAEMKENRTGLVEVADVSSGVMKIILHFLYTGILLKNWNTVDTDELLYAAAKYEIYDLLEFLDVVIGRICTTENAGKLLNLARKLNLKRAEADLFNFVKNSFETFNQVEKCVKDANSDIVFGFVRYKM